MMFVADTTRSRERKFRARSFITIELVSRAPRDHNEFRLHHHYGPCRDVGVAPRKVPCGASRVRASRHLWRTDRDYFARTALGTGVRSTVKRNASSPRSTVKRTRAPRSPDKMA